ncbi:MAG: hypothetical protein HKN82_06370 [Akkermansiaceae bacterium]|nr:hypothetical protein [Akkermansiaceae bacterium]
MNKGLIGLGAAVMIVAGVVLVMEATRSDPDDGRGGVAAPAAAEPRDGSAALSKGAGRVGATKDAGKRLSNRELLRMGPGEWDEFFTTDPRGRALSPEVQVEIVELSQELREAAANEESPLDVVEMHAYLQVIRALVAEGAGVAWKPPAFPEASREP